MTEPESTVRPEIKLTTDRVETNGRPTSYPWAASSPPQVMGLVRTHPRAPGRSAASNTEGDGTASPATIDTPDVKAVVPTQPSLGGKRRFVAAYQWEGVVEEIAEETFTARLVPYEGGRPRTGQVEYATFAFDDLADESDWEMVAPDAVFYWTVGKSRDDWGTYRKTSLVRFRRLPAPTPVRARAAAREARGLLEDLGG
jgi:hypothetical protein